MQLRFTHTHSRDNIDGSAPEVVSNSNLRHLVGALSTLEFLTVHFHLRIYEWCTQDLDKSCHVLQTEKKFKIKASSTPVCRSCMAHYVKILSAQD